MTTKTSTVHARIQPAVKAKAESVLHKLGISTSEAITLYFKQIALQKGIPFEVRIPNKTTRKAMEDVRLGRTKKVSSVEELMRDLDA